MSAQLLGPNREAHIWARLMQAHRGDPSQEVARYLLSIGFGDGDRDRMQQLPVRSEDFLAVREALMEEGVFPAE